MAQVRKFPGHDFRGVKTVTTSTTLTKEDSGKIIAIDTTTARVVTLPPVTPGNRGTSFHIVARQLASSGAHEIAPNANDKIFASFATSTAAADDKSIYFGTDASGTGDKIGDFIVLQSDGVDGWHQIAGSGSLFREA
jgi:hypothetical protein